MPHPGHSPARPGSEFPRLLLATGNPGKARELALLLEGVPYTLVTLFDLGLADDVEETGETLEENAVLKARTYAARSGLPALADDSGLEVDALGGEPGARSRRYAGDGASDDGRVRFLLERMAGVPRHLRTARFRCALALASPGGGVVVCQGICHGIITLEPRGTGGFGYDPVFLAPELGRTLAELTPEEKNRVSHRARAAREAALLLRDPRRLPWGETTGIANDS